MGFTVKRIGLTLMVLAGIYVLFPETSGYTASSNNSYLNDARKLASLEEDYFRKRVRNDWEGLYAYQHPDFRKAVSFEEYKYFEGHLVFNYREGVDHHISGGLMPPLAYIKANPEKKDPLGYPIPRRYRWYTNPFITIKNYVLRKISISRDGKHAMVEVELKGREKLNPALVRGHIEFDISKPHVDYWEKVDGRWKIALLANPLVISGGSKVPYFIPNSNAAWEKMKFVEFRPKPRAPKTKRNPGKTN